jgi:flagellar basal body-associated protein FliL
VRNQVTNALIDVDRNELIDLEGKRRIRKIILDRLNGWIPEGQLLNVYFSRLMVE